jgi:hypothetical protein
MAARSYAAGRPGVAGGGEDPGDVGGNAIACPDVDYR